MEEAVSGANQWIGTFASACTRAVKDADAGLLSRVWPNLSRIGVRALDGCERILELTCCSVVFLVPRSLPWTGPQT